MLRGTSFTATTTTTTKNAQLCDFDKIEIPGNFKRLFVKRLEKKRCLRYRDVPDKICLR